MVAIMGPSGSGKSTFLHLLGALETPTGGEIALGGQRYDGLGDAELTRLRRDRIGFVFQFFNLLPALSAEENVLLPALIAGRRDEKARERGRELLARVGLSARLEHLPSELSGGEQQRVSIARALLTEPELVLADEPTGNLDSRSSAEVLDLLRELNRTEGQTLVIVTHDPDGGGDRGAGGHLPRRPPSRARSRAARPSGSSTASPAIDGEGLDPADEPEARPGAVAPPARAAAGLLPR